MKLYSVWHFKNSYFSLLTIFLLFPTAFIISGLALAIKMIRKSFKVRHSPAPGDGGDLPISDFYYQELPWHICPSRQASRASLTSNGENSKKKVPSTNLIFF